MGPTGAVSRQRHDVKRGGSVYCRWWCAQVLLGKYDCLAGSLAREGVVLLVVAVQVVLLFTHTG